MKRIFGCLTFDEVVEDNSKAMPTENTCNNRLAADMLL
jgi:hypothetical protein